MRRQYFSADESGNETEFKTDDYQNWLPIFQRLGLKPRKFFGEREAVFAGTADGWFRLSLKKYDKQELKWIRSVLEYLSDHSFNNWAVPWQKTIIWEENTFCYLIQPWLLTKEYFQANDPASISRVAEILAEFYDCGKDYCGTRGIDLPDRWQTVDLEWEISLNKLDQYKNGFEHEKLHKEVDDLRKKAVMAVNDCLNIWKKSGLTTLLEHHQLSGVLGHGNLAAKNIIWCGNDYYLLNWEGLAFQPRVADIASLINDVAWWEPDWILFLLNECSKIQPFWPEEQHALLALLKYPKKIIELFNEESTEEGLVKKNLKEVARELAKKDRCLTKAWKELGSQKRWAWNRQEENSLTNQGKISLVLSPVESWGNFAGQADSLIHLQHEQKLPSDVIERLNYPNPDKIVAGRDGNILDSAAKTAGEPNENHFIEIVEPQPKIPEETVPDVPDLTEINPLAEQKGDDAPETAPSGFKAKEEPCPAPENALKTDAPQVIKWAGFPKPVGEKHKLGR
ncbi:MAG: hypothetical protein ACM3X9_02495 [Bacillota bacterium]